MLLGEGSERPALESLANTLGIAKYVTFAGFVKEVDALLATSSIFVLSSRSEGLPNALIEAMAMGNAAIAADCDFGPRDIISHGQNGLLVPVDDVGALGEALSALMGDMEQRQMLASQALQVRKRFAADFVTAKWERVIDEVACGEG